MNDLKYDIATMEMAVENGDFVITDKISEQNGGLFLYTKNTNLEFPLAGVGIGQETMNAGYDVLNRELNRWQSQVKQDGAKAASFTINIDNEGKMTFQTACSYE
jgi:hypothetical protein